MDGETGVLKTFLYQLFEYKKAKTKQILASNYLVEAGEAQAPSYRNIIELLKERRALAVKFEI